MVTYVSNLYPALECDDSMVFVVFFLGGGLGNVLLETYKEEGLEERGMKMKISRDFLRFDAIL